MSYSQDFSLERLDRILRSVHSHVHLRHDVDYDIDCAVEMARFVRHRGLTSTFYFMVRGDYNVLCPSVREKIKTIARLGHRIGAHIDLEVPREQASPNWYVAKRCEEGVEILAIDHARTTRVSFHQPPHDVRGRFVSGYISANDDSWQGCYFADSRGVWRCDPEAEIEKRRGLAQPASRMMLGLHPEWWFLPPGEAQAMRGREATKP